MLTPRQVEILKCLADGMVWKQIEARLKIAHCTLDNHLKNIRERLEADTTTQAVAIAIKRGYL